MDYEALGRRIREERRKLAMTQEKLAELVGLSTPYIGQIERGEKSLTLDKLVKISNVFGVTVDYLLAESVPMREEPLFNIWNQLMYGRSEKELALAVNMVKLMFSHLDDTATGERIQEGYYVLNTNVKACPADDVDMLENHKASANFAPAKFAIKRIQQGDKVFLYRSGTGIVAVGIGSGKLVIKNYHDDPAHEDEEYYTPLDEFHRLRTPLTASDIKRITGMDYRFMSTLFGINHADGEQLWAYIQKNCI